MKKESPRPSHILRNHSDEIVDASWGPSGGGEPWLVIRHTKFDELGGLSESKVIRLSPENVSDLIAFIDRGSKYA